MQIPFTSRFAINQANNHQVKRGADQKSKRLGVIYQPKCIYDKTCVTKQNLKTASGQRGYHQSLKEIRLHLSIFFRKEKQAEKNRLNNT
jgi:hypothetical protein